MQPMWLEFCSAASKMDIDTVQAEPDGSPLSTNLILAQERNSREARQAEDSAVPRLLTGTPILIKRYARDRLYDAAHERYVTIEMLRTWQAQAVAFTVLDAETGKDLTRVLLA